MLNKLIDFKMFVFSPHKFLKDKIAQN